VADHRISQQTVASFNIYFSRYLSFWVLPLFYVFDSFFFFFQTGIVFLAKGFFAVMLGRFSGHSKVLFLFCFVFQFGAFKLSPVAPPPAFSSSPSLVIDPRFIPSIPVIYGQL
jgi:hypothetical protein